MRSAITFIVVMAIGAAFALVLDRAGLGFIAGFALGIGYMLAAAIGINTGGRTA
jgi:hypothetical protein